MKALLIDAVEVKEIDIENNLKALQKAVDGFVEVVTLIPEQAVMIVNEEGHLRGLGINLIASAVANTLIVGNALIVGVNGEEFTDVPEATVDSILYDYK